MDLEQQASDLDAVMGALDEVLAALDRHDDRAARIRARAEAVRARSLAGESYLQVVEQVGRPAIVSLLSESLRDLADAGAILRRDEARALRAEGCTIDRVAQIFGVSRQRVSVLLRDHESLRTI
jgi:hypothetical protein